ncbi:MAG: DUF3575 domain-containing protein [Bacteroidales bacterium]|nr:DUF3575 domain-containing protein [Bacteroidales bacterium]
MKRIFLLLLLALAGVSAAAQYPMPAQTFVVRFLNQDTNLYPDTKMNQAELRALYGAIELYAQDLRSGRLVLHITGYCASASNTDRNNAVALARANALKSDVVSKKGLQEQHIIVAAIAQAYNSSKDVAVAVFRVGNATVQSATGGQYGQPQDSRPPTTNTYGTQEQNFGKSQRVVGAFALPVPPQRELFGGAPYRFALRTNMLYDLALMPNIGLEWRITPKFGLKVDGGYSDWSFNNGEKIHKFTYVNPELRWYLNLPVGLYVGVGGNYCDCTVKPKDIIYDGKFWNVGAIVGYQLWLSERLTLDFNAGLGCTFLNYDTYKVNAGQRTLEGSDVSRKIPGPSQLTIALSWKLDK